MAFVDEIQADHYPTKHYKTSFSLNRGGTFGAVCKYGVERKVTHHSTLGATMAFGLPIGVTLTIKVTRGQQTYLFPLHLADEVRITMTVRRKLAVGCRGKSFLFPSNDVKSILRAKLRISCQRKIVVCNVCDIHLKVDKRHSCGKHTLPASFIQAPFVIAKSGSAECGIHNRWSTMMLHCKTDILTNCSCSNDYSITSKGNGLTGQ